MASGFYVLFGSGKIHAKLKGFSDSHKLLFNSIECSTMLMLVLLVVLCFLT